MLFCVSDLVRHVVSGMRSAPTDSYAHVHCYPHVDWYPHSYARVYTDTRTCSVVNVESDPNTDIGSYCNADTYSYANGYTDSTPHS